MHIKDILKNYEVVQAPKGFLGNNIRLPTEGRFFAVTPNN